MESTVAASLARHLCPACHDHSRHRASISAAEAANDSVPLELVIPAHWHDCLGSHAGNTGSPSSSISPVRPTPSTSTWHLPWLDQHLCVLGSAPTPAANLHAPLPGSDPTSDNADLGLTCEANPSRALALTPALATQRGVVRLHPPPPGPPPARPIPSHLDVAMESTTVAGLARHLCPAGFMVGLGTSSSSYY